MKKTLIILVLLSGILSSAFADYPPAGWTDSITQAIAEAQRDDKMLMLNFTGSDWCGWCDKLESEVLDKREFKNWADKNIVKVFIDFPQGIVLSDSQKKHNEFLQQALGVQGFPTIFLLGSDLTPLLRTGYRQGGASEYIRHLEEDQIEIDPKAAEEFRQGMRSSIERYIGPIPD